MELDADSEASEWRLAHRRGTNCGRVQRDRDDCCRIKDNCCQAKKCEPQATGCGWGRAVIGHGGPRDRTTAATHARITPAPIPAMIPDVQNLIELQKIDREILRLREEVAALPKPVASMEERLAGTKAVRENAKSAFRPDEANRRMFVSATSDLQPKICRY